MLNYYALARRASKATARPEKAGRLTAPVTRLPPQNFASSPSGILPPLARKSAKQSPDAASPMQTEAVMGQRKGNLSK